MGSNLSTKLRALVARSFKAEKLYSSSAKEAEGSLEARSMATEVKAKEWGIQYNKLRVALNRMIREVPASEMTKSVYELSLDSAQTVSECDYATTRLKMEVPVASKKQEYSRLMSLSKQLLQVSARRQAAHSIHEELVSILESSMGRKAFNAMKASSDTGSPDNQNSIVVEESSNVIAFPKASGAN